MDFKQHLNDVANRYRSQGYQVVERPEPKDLPDFAKTFKVEIVARRADGSALVSAKKTPKELEADPDVTRYAETTEKQSGWRFDVIVLGPNDEAEPPEKRDAKEPSEEDFRHQFDTVQRLLAANVNQQALVLAWSVLEAAMRRRLQAEGEEAGWGSSPRTMMNELLSAGLLSNSVFRDLEGLFQARSAIVHGFTTPIIDAKAVNFILDVARKLLEESKAVRQPA
ncbi:MAG TPA: hypothetical protein VMV10_28965 [Pirellulales bacterium]|nr:hypothetical protein [Pirellulales bacterium]